MPDAISRRIEAVRVPVTWPAGGEIRKWFEGLPAQHQIMALLFAEAMMAGAGNLFGPRLSRELRAASPGLWFEIVGGVSLDALFHGDDAAGLKVAMKFWKDHARGIIDAAAALERGRR